ncbi:hypothetical protein [Aquifex pyrophilus]
MARKRGRNFKKISVSLPRSTYYILLGIAQGDEKKLNKLLRGIIEDKFRESTIEELQMYVAKPEKEEEEIKTEEVKEEEKASKAQVVSS